MEISRRFRLRLQAIHEGREHTYSLTVIVYSARLSIGSTRLSRYSGHPPVRMRKSTSEAMSVVSSPEDR